MEFYKKCEESKEFIDYEIAGLRGNDFTDYDIFLISQVTKPQVIISLALRSLKNNNRILWIGSGAVADKAILCSNITKKRLKLIYEAVHITYKRKVEYWEPIKEGLDKLQVTRSIPTVLIFQSILPLTEHGILKSKNIYMQHKDST